MKYISDLKEWPKVYEAAKNMCEGDNFDSLMIDEAFEFNLSPQGHHFWSEIAYYGNFEKAKALCPHLFEDDSECPALNHQVLEEFVNNDNNKMVAERDGTDRETRFDPEPEPEPSHPWLLNAFVEPVDFQTGRVNLKQEDL